MGEIDLAYCAGVIDSDGTIGIKRQTYSMRVVGDSKQPTYAARICVRQVERGAIDLLRATFGGSVRVNRSTTGRDLFEWSVRDKIAENALRLLLPFLRIKREQAVNCLELRDLIAKSKVLRVAVGRGHAGAASRPIEISDAMAATFLRAKHLNRVGVRND